MKKLLSAFAVSVLILASCEKKEDSLNIDIKTATYTSDDYIALNFINFFNENNNGNRILAQLTENKFPISMDALFSDFSETKSQKTLKKQINSIKKNDNQQDIFELWLHNVTDSEIDTNKLLVVYSSENIENQKFITAFDLNGNKTLLNSEVTPNIPVIIIEKDGYHTLQLQVANINQKLKEAGLQSEHSFNFSKTGHNNVSIETTRLDKIELKDDKEPWIKGGAEIYAITSGIKDSSNKPEIQVIPMYYLDHDKHTYYPNQILLYWDKYAYQAANIQLFEKDSNYNYQDLSGIIVKGIAEIGATLSEEEWIGALGTIGASIVKIIPSSVFTDDDNYVDSFYTIEKNKVYSNHNGASGNAKVSLSPFKLLEN